MVEEIDTISPNILCMDCNERCCDRKWTFKFDCGHTTCK